MLSIFDEGPFAPCPEPFNLARHVLAGGLAAPDKPALLLAGEAEPLQWSHAELRRAVLGTAAGLLAEGLAPGDRLLLRIGNSVEFPVAFLGAIAAGIVPVPTSSQLTQTETRKLIDIVSPAAILHDGETPCPSDGPRRLATGGMRGWYDRPPAAFDLGSPDRLAYIIFTSGTSGTPRAVEHAHRAVWARQMMVEDWYGLRASDRLMHAGAFNWTYTLGTGLLDPWTIGATAIIPAQGVGHDRLPALLREHRATIFAAAPGVYRRLLATGLPELPDLRHGLSAGEKLPRSLREGWTEATGRPVYEAYGMSECSTFISTSPHDAVVDPDSLGRPQRGRRVAILGEDGPVPRGTPGVIAIDRRDPGLMLGYHGAPEATAERFRDNWFLTGDMGQMSEAGEIRYLGRDDDMMNAGGFRVSPIEVEHALVQHPDIHEVGATDIELRPDVRVIAAFYTADAEIPEATLRDWAASRLARYKQPRVFQRIAALPRNPNGKVLRRELAGLYGERRG